MKTETKAENKTEEKVVAVAGDKEVTTPISGFGFDAFKTEENEVVGLEALNASDMKLPKYKLMQQTSLEVSKSKGKILPGQFLNTITGEAFDTLEIVPLDLGKSMVYWKQPFKRGEDPLCRSFDGIHKTDGCGDGDCATCQFSSQNPKAWKTLKENETKPACNMAYVWLGIDAKTSIPFRMIMSGSSVSITKDFLNILAPLRISPFCTKVTLTSEQKENDQGVFYVVNYNHALLVPNSDLLDVNGKPIPQKMKEMKDLSITYKEIFMTQIIQNDIVDVDSNAAGENVDTGNGVLF